MNITKPAWFGWNQTDCFPCWRKITWGDCFAQTILLEQCRPFALDAWKKSDNGFLSHSAEILGIRKSYLWPREFEAEPYSLGSCPKTEDPWSGRTGKFFMLELFPCTKAPSSWCRWGGAQEWWLPTLCNIRAGAGRIGCTLPQDTLCGGGSATYRNALISELVVTGDFPPTEVTSSFFLFFYFFFFFPDKTIQQTQSK